VLGNATEVARKCRRGLAEGFVDNSPVVKNLNTLRLRESQERKGRKQAICFLRFSMETLKHARTTRVDD